MTVLALTKHHALGNDFLVLLDLEGRHAIDAPLARALCDRHRGVGADGVIRVAAGSGGNDVTMELRNADGGPAETSGNGLRCLAQAVVEAGVVSGPELLVGTTAGPRRVVVQPHEDPHQMMAQVEMGPAKVGPEQPVPPPAERARNVDMGNPHIVLLGPDPQALDVARLGADMETRHAGGINVEFLAAGPGRDEVTIRIWERGVGETLACGTGACAAAAAARSWGLVDDHVVVQQPGGDLRVSLAGETVVLTGPAVHVCSVEVS